MNPLLSKFSGLSERIADLKSHVVLGTVVEVRGPVVKATLPNVGVGDLCQFLKQDDSVLCHGEVVGFDKELVIVAILGDSQGLTPQTRIVACKTAQTIEVSDELIGRVLDGMGNFIDGGKPLANRGRARKIYADPPPPLQRQLISQPLPMQIRALDGLLTIGEGQRVGVFAAAGVGKSTLLSQMVKGAECDICIVALIGERGREVREFIEHDLGPEGMKRAIVVCATSDRSALERARAAYMATSIAEHYRDEGKRVLLLMDSVTRFARALREIGLSAGEPPARAGFPPSVFATLPRLLERSGMGTTGSITAVYTVLVEGDDMTEPIADETRSILDGHIILSRDLAASNHYPAIDILASVSRVMPMIASASHKDLAAKLRSLMAAYKKSEILLKVGEYQQGADPLVDEAIIKMPAILEFLHQGTAEFSDFAKTQEDLQQLLA